MKKILLFIIISIITLSAQNGGIIQESNDILLKINIKDFIECIYYIIFSVVAILTYYNANKTFFNPFKNEVFKKQIDEISSLYIFFEKQKELDILHSFGISETISCNIIQLLDNYGQYKKWLKKDLKERPYQKCKVFLMSKEYAEKNLKKPLEKEEEKEIAFKEPIWEEYKYDVICISEKYISKIKELELYINSPFIPIELQKKLVDLKSKMDMFNSNLGVELNNISINIPDKIKTPYDLEDGASWIHNLLNERKQENIFEEIVEDILLTIRKYLRTDEVFKL